MLSRVPVISFELVLSNPYCFYNTDTKAWGGKKLRFHLDMVAHTMAAEARDFGVYTVSSRTANNK